MQEVTISAIGLSRPSEAMLKRILRISHSRGLACQYVKQPAQDNVHIMFIDRDDEQAMSRWRAWSDSMEHVVNPHTSTVFVGSLESESHLDSSLQAPLRVLPTLAMLEKLVNGYLERVPTHSHNAEDGEQHHQQPAVSATEWPSQALTDSPSTSPPAALLLDDSLPVRLDMANELRELGLEVDAFESGEGVLEAIRDSRCYDIMFLDVVLPGMDGYQVCRQIRQDSNHRGTPVIMLTGKSSSFDKIRGSLAGCDDYLLKPVQRPQLRDMVDKFLHTNTLTRH